VFLAALLVRWGDEADGAVLGGSGGCHEFAKGAEEASDGLIVGGEFLLVFGQTPGEVLVGGEETAQADEGTHDVEARFDRAGGS
jgi:hypothetical protein